MIRPKNIKQYDDIDLKLGIKSSFPNAKSTLAMLIMFWQACDKPSEIAYSKANGNKIVIADALKDKLIKKFQPFYSVFKISDDDFIKKINSGDLFENQMEPLHVGIELVWRLACIRFSENRSQSAERTGGERFCKTLFYTSNMDIIDILIESDDNEYSNVLLKWIGCINDDETKADFTLTRLLTCLAEDSIYRMEVNGDEIIYNLNSVYEALLENRGIAVDIIGEEESKGSLRTLKSALTANLNPYLSYPGGSVNISRFGAERLKDYQNRVDNYIKINFGTLQKILKSSKTPELTHAAGGDETARVKGGTNYLLYGVPGSGKSYTVETEFCKDPELTERVVFHPDYSNSDFIGQIIPKIDESKCVYYDFSPGPFTRMLKKAYTNPGKMYYLIIEELNRGNAPAIFGEMFQLLDRTENADNNGESSYGIINFHVADFVYGDQEHPVLIPSNLSIAATMNTSDQNVFTLDTAFQRRWRMRMIENDIKKAAHAKKPILDTTVEWQKFNIAVNDLILENNSRLSSCEDKRLGAYFVTPSDLDYSNSEEQLSRFPEKVLKYLWDDAFKFSREVIFDMDNNKSLEDIINKFKSAAEQDRFKSIFKENFLNNIGIK